MPTLSNSEGALMQSFGLRAVGYADRSKARTRARAVSYSCSVKPVSRSSGRSATAAAAYRNAELIVDQRTGERHDYTRRSGVEHVSWFAPAGCREQTSAELWNRAEAAEKRKNSTVAREVLAALPHELNQFQRRELVERMTTQLAGRYGVAGTAGIHAPDREGDQRNWHVHILMTTRRIDPATGELGAKTRELDDLKTGPAEVVWIRQMVEREGNAALERAGHAARLDCRSLADQGIDRAPTTHEGPRVTAIRRECEQQQRPPLGLCDRMAANDELAELEAQRAELAELDAQIYYLEELAPAQAAAAAERLRIEQQTAAGRRLAELREQLPEARQALAEATDRAAELRSMAEPPAYQQAIAQRQPVAQLEAEAQRQTAAAAQWRQAHPARAWIADKLGIEPAADRAAREARDAAQTAREARDAARAAHRAYDAGDTKAQAVAWQQTRTELASIEQRLPELREQQRQIEDELLQHAGPEALRKATEQQLARAQRAEQHMQPHDLEHAQECRQELADRLHQDATPAEQVKLYRDAEQHAKDAQQLGEAGAQVRSITCLRMARERLAEARQALKDAPEPELAGQLAEADAQAREWQMDPRQRGSVDDCERLLEQSGELRDRAQEAAQQLQERRQQELARQIDEKLAQRVERDPGPRSSGPRMG